MELKTLKIKNFKGIKDKLVQFGKTTRITGRNASGKTTIQDAYTWLLFDRDSQNSTTAEFRPLNENGEFENLDPVTVTAEITHKDKIHTLTKELKTRIKDDKITNTCKYYVDDLELTKGKYKDFINEIADELTFKLLSNPFYFATLSTDDKRKLLMQLLQDPTDELKAELPDLADLIEENRNADTTDKIKSYTTSINKGKKEIDSIKSKLEEYRNSSYDEKEDEDVNYQLDQHQKELRTRLDNEVAEITKLENKIKELENTDDTAVLIAERKTQLNELHQEKTMFENQLKQFTEIADGLRENWARLDHKKTELVNNAYCPTCKQELPKDQIQAHIDKIDKELKAIIDMGKKYSSEADKYKDNLKDTLSQIDLLNEDLRKLEQAFVEAKTSPIQAEITKLRIQISEIQNTDHADIEDKIKELREKASHIALNKMNIDRKKELEEQLHYEQDRLNTLERNQYNLIQVEELKNKKLEDELNNLSDKTKFKLFEKTNSGETKPTCKIMVNTNNSLVDYDNANMGGKINAGLDVIKMLSTNNEPLPIWIDNTESIELKLDTQAQIIMLEVKKGQELKIETEDR